MDFRKETRGTGATKSVDLVACFYDTSVAMKDGKASAHYGEFWGHPDAEVGKDQSNLALVTQRSEVNGKPQFDHSVAFYPAQMEAIKAAAGDNHSPLLDKDGVARGTIYGIKGDLMSVQREGKTVGFMPNTKTLQASELSVGDKDGAAIRTRIFDSMAASRAAQEAEKAGAEAPKAEAPQAEAAAPVAEKVPEAELV